MFINKYEEKINKYEEIINKYEETARKLRLFICPNLKRLVGYNQPTTLHDGHVAFVSPACLPVCEGRTVSCPTKIITWPLIRFHPVIVQRGLARQVIWKSP